VLGRRVGALCNTAACPRHGPRKPPGAPRGARGTQGPAWRASGSRRVIPGDRVRGVVPCRDHADPNVRDRDVGPCPSAQVEPDPQSVRVVQIDRRAVQVAAYAPQICRVLRRGRGVLQPAATRIKHAPVVGDSDLRAVDVAHAVDASDGVWVNLKCRRRRPDRLEPYAVGARVAEMQPLDRRRTGVRNPARIREPQITDRPGVTPQRCEIVQVDLEDQQRRTCRSDYSDPVDAVWPTRRERGVDL